MSETSTPFNQRYFSSFLQTLDKSGIQLRTPRKAYEEHRQKIDSWPTKIDTAVKILKSSHQICVDLTFKGDGAAAQFDRVKEHQADFNQIVGGNLEWKDHLPKERQIVSVLSSANPADESDWPRQHAWLAAKLAALRIAFEFTLQSHVE